MKTPWNLRQLFTTPKTYPVRGVKAKGVEAIYYDSVPHRGKPTRVFAWLGLPKLQPGETAPGIVLIHGGGGTAFDRWVRLWTKRGYAAIAMDTCGCVPVGEYANWKRHHHGGPFGSGDFESIDKPVIDQWPYHSVAAVVLGHSLLRSRPEVDNARVGATGISWGGYLTSIVAGLDSRLAFAAPVYGCGRLGEGSGWVPQFIEMGEERANHWLRLWDPVNYLPRAAMPMLWTNGTNDSYYHMPSWQRSSQLPTGLRTLSLQVGFPHDHVSGENVREVRAFADNLCFNAPALPTITRQRESNGTLMVHYAVKEPLRKATLCYTTDIGYRPHRRWRTRPAILNSKVKLASADIPARATCYFLNLTDARGNIVSSEHVER